MIKYSLVSLLLHFSSAISSDHLFLLSWIIHRRSSNTWAYRQWLSVESFFGPHSNAVFEFWPLSMSVLFAQQCSKGRREIQPMKKKNISPLLCCIMFQWSPFPSSLFRSCYQSWFFNICVKQKERSIVEGLELPFYCLRFSQNCGFSFSSRALVTKYRAN